MKIGNPILEQSVAILLWMDLGVVQNLITVGLVSLGYILEKEPSRGNHIPHPISNAANISLIE